MNEKVLQKGKIGSLIVILITSLFAVFSCQNSTHPAKKISLNPLFTDNMVLQRDQEIPVWGKSEPGGEVVVTLNGQKKKGVADDNGSWKVELSPISAGGPYELIISGTDEHKIKNVMVGEVWICSGQSNMEMAVNTEWGKINNAEEEVANANYPNIRLMMVNKTMATTPQENFTSSGWKECSPETVAKFSAVAYLFGRKLYKELNVPIGLIETAWGGTVVEAWTSAKALKNINEYVNEIDALNTGLFERKKYKRSDNKAQKAWINEVQGELKKSGILSRGYNKYGYDSKDWKTLDVPKIWENQNIDFDGVMWVKKEITIPESWKGKDLILSLGAINDYDITWFNGEVVGSMPNAAMPRSYKIPKELVKVGRNEITVLILDIGNNGGIYGSPKSTIIGYSKEATISLAGKWKYKKDKFDLNLLSHPPMWDISVAQNRPTVLYNAMINPLLPYGIRGAIWYQGESNAERAMQYRKLFKALINDWRAAWGQGNFQFLFVQLANFMKRSNKPTDDSWAHLREAQTMALELPNTGMAVTIDIGEAKDIHPKNKQEVGRRLALIALAKTYGKDIPYSGPMFKSMKKEGSKIRLQFTNTDKGLKIKGGKQLKGFAIAGTDKKFVWAKAKIDGDEVIVWNSKIKNPVAVRYAWASNPLCNLYNGADLPASPFRTDSW
ncbi:Sialic acid-specific 9-O-acetylesterase [hydrothermal vent metagenome]|uniref:Sialic acid-specific 9-O-acetylesterase n=2 Tax=hydrothermal vent metagenome TaxID=652676 RepID=A0A3B1D294_9ZZZZ